MLSDTAIYGLLGRIHVLLRRITNRITDVEYMRVNRDYAREILKLAEGCNHDELSSIALQLRQAMELDPPPKAPDMSAANPQRDPDEVKRPYLFSLR